MREVTLEKNPYFTLGKAKRPTEKLILDDFMATANQATLPNSNYCRSVPKMDKRVAN